ncbi:hypothetical protein [Pajaroellobacter abortibovis]|uniref:Uncharacterized protein n=1 Tax=Pajaroellobacter abortibovis TaxID=1882918 RepID=A0A1L6MZD3_9BACT|nr:hypothetical protein [Pajaroellobacter abortibovis]APS00886.1 hypothetical protein BCY86_04495 [Pajaroellobacter abortibovis]
MKSLTSLFFWSNPQIRRWVLIIGWSLASLLIVGLPLGLVLSIHRTETYNKEMRTTLQSIVNARPKIYEQNLKNELVQKRYQTPAPPLAGFLEQVASTQKIQLSDSFDHSPVPIGKYYTERYTLVHLKRVRMGSLARFFETIENSGSPIVLSKLNIKKRTGEHDSYDVEVGVSAFDRVEQKKESSLKASKSP